MDRRDPLAEDLVTHAAWARRVVRGMVRDPQLAEDLVQDAVEAGLRERSGAIRDPRAWLVGVARRLHAKSLRSDERRRAREQRRGELGSAEAPSELLERVETQRMVAKAVLDLPEPYRTVLVRRFYDEEPVRRIAASRGESRKTIENQVYRGLRVLRVRLADRLGPGWVGATLPLLAPGSLLAPGAVAASGAIMKSKITVACLGILLLVAAVLTNPWSVESPSVPADGELAVANAAAAAAADEPRGVERVPQEGDPVGEPEDSETAMVWNDDPMLLEGVIVCEGERFGWPLQVRFTYGSRPGHWLVTTEEDGSFEIPCPATHGGWLMLPGDHYEVLSVTGVRYLQQARAHLIDFWGLDGRLVVTVRLKPAMVGRLLDADGQPVDGLAKAEWRGTRDESAVYHGSYCPTDADGNFRVPYPEIEEAGDLTLRLEEQDGSRDLVVEIVKDDLPHDGDLGDFRLPPGRDVTLRVRDRYGAPVPGAQVTREGSTVPQETDEDGATVLRKLPTGIAQVVRVVGRGEGIARATIPPDGPDEVEVRLQPCGTIRVEFQKPPGVHTEDFRFRYVEPPGGFVRAGEALPVRIGDLLRGADYENTERLLDNRIDLSWSPADESAMTITGLQPGVPHQLTCYWRGARVWSTTVEPLREDETRVVECTPEMPERMHRVEIVDAFGDAVPDASVACRIPAGSSDRQDIQVLIPDTTGSVLVPEEGADGVRYMVHHYDYESRDFGRRIPESVVLRSSGDFVLTVRRADGKPLGDGVRVSIRYRSEDGDDLNRRGLGRRGGRFEFNHVRSGIVTVEVRLPDGSVVTREHDTRLGDLTVELDR